jgi:maltose O-acetyltransferase
VTARLVGTKKNLSVGAGSTLGKAVIVLHAPVVIGQNVAINDAVTILTASHGVADPKWRTLREEVTIDDYAWIAQGATLLPGVHIGQGAVVGAAAVVSRDVEPFTVVVGNPAKVATKKRTERLEYTPAVFVAEYEAWLGNPNAPESASE